MNAVSYLIKQGWDKKNDSRKFDVVYRDHRLPPKEVIRHAWAEALNTTAKNFSGGPEANNFLTKFGFEIRNKSESTKSELLDEIIDLLKSDLSNSEKERLVKCRLGQGQYREELIELWKECPITGISNKSLLMASHIKPWKTCESKIEKVDKYNGILLSPLFDKLFDSGFISFKDDGKILISKCLDKTTLMHIENYKNKKVSFRNKHLKYINFHREVVFAK